MGISQRWLCACLRQHEWIVRQRFDVKGYGWCGRLWLCKSVPHTSPNEKKLRWRASYVWKLWLRFFVSRVSCCGLLLILRGGQWACCTLNYAEPLALPPNIVERNDFEVLLCAVFSFSSGPFDKGGLLWRLGHCLFTDPCSWRWHAVTVWHEDTGWRNSCTRTTVDPSVYLF